jgi:hypothetical protein
MIKAFCSYIVSQLPDLVIGTSLHIGAFPQKAASGAQLPDTCSFVAERVPGTRNKYNKRRSEKRYQIVTRGNTYLVAEAEAKRIFDAVVNIRGLELDPYTETGDDIYDLYISEGNEPAFFDRDEKTRFMFSSNLTLRVRKES